jgi:hypothetical protein
VVRNDGFRKAGRWGLAGAMLVLAGCAMLGPRTPQAAVKERSQERWDDLVKGDYKAAYAFMSPGSKSVQSEEKYVASLRKDFWRSARVDKVECGTPDTCDVSLTIEYEFMGRRTKTPLLESWVREGSDWWYVQK